MFGMVLSVFVSVVAVRDGDGHVRGVVGGGHGGGWHPGNGVVTTVRTMVVPCVHAPGTR